MDLPVTVKALSKLLQLVLTTYEAGTVEGFDTKELAINQLHPGCWSPPKPSSTSA